MPARQLACLSMRHAGCIPGPFPLRRLMVCVVLTGQEPSAIWSWPRPRQRPSPCKQWQRTSGSCCTGCSSCCVATRPWQGGHQLISTAGGCVFPEHQTLSMLSLSTIATYCTCLCSGSDTCTCSAILAAIRDTKSQTHGHAVQTLPRAKRPEFRTEPTKIWLHSDVLRSSSSERCQDDIGHVSL